ncbi:MAG: hypothetical protein FJ125_15145 [Deltaproteobacteria bacterium]|nr:hypothetical protein [Deltaproteobacteria bacterium]
MTVRPGDGGSPVYAVDTWAIDPPAGVTPFQIFSISAQIPGADTIFPGGYLGLDEAGRFAFGYTAMGQPAPGRLVFGLPDRQVELNAPGNFDAEFWGEGRLLVDGLGLGDEPANEQGLYLASFDPDQGGLRGVRRLLTDLGDASSALVVAPEGIVVAGGFSFASGSSLLYGFGQAELEQAAAGEPLSAAAAGDIVFTGNLVAATWLTGAGAGAAGQLVIAEMDAGWSFSRVAGYPLALAGDAVQAGEAVLIASPAAGQAASVANLAAAGGVLVLQVTGGDAGYFAGVRPRP